MKTNTEIKWDFKKAGSWRCTAFLRFSIRSGTLLLSDFDFDFWADIFPLVWLSVGGLSRQESLWQTYKYKSAVMLMRRIERNNYLPNSNLFLLTQPLNPPVETCQLMHQNQITALAGICSNSSST